MKLTLQNPETDFDIIAIVHMGINDILNLGSAVETVSNSVLHIANQCRNYGVKKAIVISNQIIEYQLPHSRFDQI